MSINISRNLLAMAILSIVSSQVTAAEAPSAEIEEVMVTGKSVSYANNAASDEMVKQQSAMTSPLAVIDNLPGVLINEGDTFGSDDWSTTVSIRGFQLNLGEQQIGMTVDGLANGNSNYGGGAKANRYIDTENIQTVEVSQGTADIASRSNEALGGTLNFTTIDPGEEQKVLISYSSGDFDAKKTFIRYETGEIAPQTYAWISASSSETSDWIQGAAQNSRDHYAAKLISTVNDVNITAYASYDDTHEDNYQRVSLAKFKQNPTTDHLTDDWTGIPVIDQNYRRGWSTLRENLFTYVKFDFTVGSVEVNANVYYHDNEGRGDWLPPYIVDVTAEAAGNSELVSGNTVLGGSPLGRIFFVDADGNALATSNCDDSYNPGCYSAAAVPVSSYRNSNYGKERLGFNADFSWETQINDNLSNTLRGGIWYEDYERLEYRTWHKILDSKSSFEQDHTPYWEQYRNNFTVDTTMIYLEDQIETEMVTARLGVKKFLVDLDRKSVHKQTSASVNSDSDTLLSAGIIVQTGVEGLEVFAGYAENFAAIKDSVIEREASQLSNIEPELAENIDLGLRYESDAFNANITLYSVEFENRLVFFAPGSGDAIDYLIGTNGSYLNAGGVESKGIEASATFSPSDNLSVFLSYTNNDSSYLGDTSAFPKGNSVFGAVEDMAVISLDWQDEQYFAGISAKWVGDRWMDAANTQRIDAYTVADLYAGINLGDFSDKVSDVEIRLTVNNLSDESYLGGVSGESAWIGAPRTSAINIKASF